MQVSVTPLGDSSGTMSSAQVGTKVAEYLEGVGLLRGGRAPGEPIELPSPSGVGTVAYYADSTGIRPGRWLGARDGEVVTSDLAALIAGFDPVTGDALVTTTTSGTRRRRGADLSSLSGGPEWCSMAKAAKVLGVDRRYLRRLLDRAEAAVAADTVGDAAGEAGAGKTKEAAGSVRVATDALRAGLIERGDGATWRFHRDAISVLAKARTPPTTVLAYDVTFSVPKDVSVIFARADDAVRANILTAIDLSVAAGLSYLERNALQVRASNTQQRARNWTGAEFLHLTSRALDPQLHKHVLICNRADGDDGMARALDGRLLFLHAKTAAFLSQAELRHQLSARLGIVHHTPERGLADILGVPEAVTAEFSTRSREIDEVTTALGVDSVAARQVAAYDTRAAKRAGFHFDDVMAWWGTRMDALGFTKERCAELVLGRSHPELFDEATVPAVFALLARSDGITSNGARFDRRVVIQFFSDWCGDTLSAAAIEDLADRFLATPDVVRLATSRDSSAHVIRRGDGRAIVVSSEASYTTRSMLALEERARSHYLAGRSAGIGVVSDAVVAATLADARFAELSAEQREFATRLVSSGMAIQAGCGRAGSGKTTTLQAAVACWTAAGYAVLGTAVGGTQAIVLGEEATTEARTVASLLASYFDYDNTTSISDHTVILVDEASLLSTRDVAALCRIVDEHPGAILRLIGDTEQHASVGAGGFFRFVAEEFADDVPVLVTNYRQVGKEMAEVRLALDEYRKGMITEALNRLQRDGKITEATSADEAYDLLACAWYAERQRRGFDSTRRLSAMTAEHHHERRALNERARALLKADGTLSGPELVAGGAGFCAGDEVIARIGDHDLRAAGATRHAWVRNGSLGVVTEVADDHLVVCFERWDEVVVPRSFIEREVVPGVRGGLMCSYALTTYAAQGATMAAAMPLVTNASSREGVYVALSRPQFDLSAVTISFDKLHPSPVDDLLPVAKRELSDLEATARSLESDQRERLATSIDHRANAVNVLANTTSMRELAKLNGAANTASDIALFSKVLDERARLVSSRTILDPPAEILAHLGTRPIEIDARLAWERAVYGIALWRDATGACNLDGIADAHGNRYDEHGRYDEHSRYDEDSVHAFGPEWALGPRPDSALVVDYDEYTTAIAAAEHSFDEMEHLDDARAEQVLAVESEVPTPRDRAYAEWSDEQLLEEAAETQRDIADTLEQIDDGSAGERSRDARRTYDELVVTLNAIEEELSLRDLDLPEVPEVTVMGFSRPQAPDLAPGTTHEASLSAAPSLTWSGPSIER